VTVATASRPQTTTQIAVEARAVRKRFGQGADAVIALDDVSVAIRQNEFFTLLGPSGCGKTTLLRLIAGFEHADAGEIRLGGELIGHLPPFKRPVNTVFQSYALFPHMSVAQNIGFGLEMLGRPRGEIDATVERMLRLVRMEALAGRRITQLSGGQQQRVALARALAPKPRVLLLDEPLSALDLKLRKEMQIELKRLQHETGITFIFVTHDQEEALAMSDRIAVMNKGSILQIGTPREIYERPAVRFVADFIGETNFVEGRCVAAEGDTATVELDCGDRLKAGHPGGRPDGSRVTVAVRPEHATLVGAPEDGHLDGAIDSIVYVGTDTHVHLTLEGGAPFVVRMPNRRGAALGFEAGQRVGVLIADDAAQVLKD
jgi:spermidine/putrescine transport system ATP-binding protein